MRTVSLNKVRVTRIAGLLVLAALAIAFFALPLTSYAMRCGGGGGKNKKGSITFTPIGDVTFNSLMDNVVTTAGTVGSPSWVGSTKMAADAATIQSITLRLQPGVHTIAVWNWFTAKDANGKGVLGVIIDLKGDAWLTDGAPVKLILPPGVTIVAADKNPVV